jgi:hypothetical protein
MTRILKTLTIFAILATCAFAQTQAPQPGIDYPSPIPVPFIGYTTGTASPARCVAGMSPLFFNTATATYYFCSARNTWTAMGALGATTPTGAALSLGSSAAPWRYLYFYGAGTYGANNFRLTGSATGARVVTFPDASITVPGTRAYNGGTTSTYANSNISPTTIVHSGAAALVSTGTTSPVTIATFNPAFTSATSYVCTATPQGGTATIAAGGVALVQSSGSQIVISGPASVSTVVNYICVGN